LAAAVEEIATVLQQTQQYEIMFAENRQIQRDISKVYKLSLAFHSREASILRRRGKNWMIKLSCCEEMQS
jgi:hypothetical protein